ncbi:MAG: urease accessory protein UreE [Oscillospiraceae bacterium]|nr:urease accessory protein UreE [Oscillospiraceae bacterium]
MERIIGQLRENPAGKRIDTVLYEWFEQNSRVLKKVSSAGEEIGLRLDEPLTDGGVLFESESRIIALTLLPCEVTRVTVFSMEEMGRACFELGNRHLPIAVREKFVETPYDAPTFEYLRKSGFTCEKRTAKFTPSVIVRGHSHG